VRRALEEPMRQIAFNAGVEGSVIVEHVKELKEKGIGFNALTGKYRGHGQGGRGRPVKVCRSALAERLRASRR